MAQEEKQMSVEDVEAEIRRIRLETAKIELEQATETNAQYKANKEVRGRLNRQRQGQLRADLKEKVAVIQGCTHKQGGSPGRERKGSGPSALRVVILPDGRQLVMCANCPLRVFSPLPTNRSPKHREDETAAERKARVAKFQEDTEEFDRLLELATNQLTPEAAAPMHCGKQFSFASGEGNQIVMPAPCDSYAQGIDNRNVA